MTIKIGVIGCGQWGPNHIRNLGSLSECQVTQVADLSEVRLDQVARLFPGVRTGANPSDLIQADDVDAVIIATPTKTHFSLAREALMAGKHVLCEKPLTLLGRESEELTDLAETKGLTLMVGHVFVFNAGVIFLKERIRSGALGRICYLDAVRTNLGPIRRDVGAIYDLASHDISVFNFLLDAVPTDVSAQVGHFLQFDHEDIGFLTLRYPEGIVCHIHVSWLNPQKVRQLTIVGEARMAVFDDMQPLEPVRIYDKGLEQRPHYNSFGEFQMILRDGDISIPKVRMAEPLARQSQHFLDCILNGAQPLADGNAGLAVVRTLEAAMESARGGGRLVPVGAPAPAQEYL